MRLDGGFGLILESRRQVVPVREERPEVGEPRIAVEAPPLFLRIDADLEDRASVPC